MREKIPKVNLNYYVDPKIVAAIYGGLGLELPANTSSRAGVTMGGGRQDDDDVGEEVEEEVDEDIRDSLAWARLCGLRG